MSIKSILAATLLIGATLAPAAAMAHPPHHGGYSYVYYPQRHIYYAPQSRYWYWQDRGAWRSGYYLPSAYASFAVGGINIMLDADRPYTRHAYVVERYRPAPRVVYHHNAPRYDHHAYHIATATTIGTTAGMAAAIIATITVTTATTTAMIAGTERL